MKKVFLKFNRNDESALLCLQYWLALFKNYQILIICDLFKDTGPIPKFLKPILQPYNVQIKNTDYTLRAQTDELFIKGTKVKQSCANLTCFKYLDEEDKFFWLIDADDTMFLSREFASLREKLVSAENILLNESLDGLSLDFYREAFDQWSFGVCLLNKNIDLEKLKDKSLFKNSVVNLDGAFDELRKSGSYQLKSFVINGYGFQHLINRFKGLKGGIYFWNDGMLWDIPLKDDVIIL